MGGPRSENSRRHAWPGGSRPRTGSDARSSSPSCAPTGAPCCSPRARAAPADEPRHVRRRRRGRVVISTYPDRAKAVNLRRSPAASLCVLGEDFDDAWVQVDGTAEVIDLPESVEPLVDYYRAVAGEHPDWDEYREAMVTRASPCCA
ncbi:pyridoxamine 5'-phosphate oxidase family protein [Oerskovia sp. M15]